MKSTDQQKRKGISRRGFLGTALAGVGISATGAAGWMRAAPLFGQGREPQAGALSAAAGAPGTDQGSASSTPARPRIREYRTLGRTGVKVSDVSFGAGNLNTAAVLAAALDAGINYVDTAEHYENGNSERAIGEVLKERDRKSVFLTTKLNFGINREISKEGLRNRFGKCLERLQTDHADCLMIHMCTLAQIKHEPYHELIRGLKAEGKVRFSGLSNHGADYSLSGRLDDKCEDVVAAAAEDGRFDVVLCTFNFLKEEAGAKIFKACREKGMGVTLMKMNPALTTEQDRRTIASIRERYKKSGREIPEATQKIFKLTDDRAAAAEAFLKKHGLGEPEQIRGAAIKYCLSRPDVHCVCPSINTFEDLDAYLPLSGGRFEASDAEMLADCREVYGDLSCRIGCGECEPACPRGVPVAAIMRYKYYFRNLGREKAAMTDYAALAGCDAGLCDGCDGPCEKACPHGVPIPGLLALTHELLTLG